MNLKKENMVVIIYNSDTVIDEVSTVGMSLRE